MSLNRITVVCASCQQEFLVHPYRRDSARFCSRSCTGKSPKPSRRQDPVTRFWAKVQKTASCWLWTGSIGTKGHGLFRPGSGLTGAHRFSWELHHGPVPAGQNVLHNCPGGDNPACVNPAHLWLGTLSENNTDRHQKGRDNPAVGKGHYRAAFTEADIEAIRRRYAAGGVLQSQLAAEYGVNKHTIHCIIRRKTWKHL